MRSSPGWLVCWQRCSCPSLSSVLRKRIVNIIVQNQKKTLYVMLIMDFSTISIGFVLICCSWTFGQQIFILLLYYKYMLYKSENSQLICIFLDVIGIGHYYSSSRQVLNLTALSLWTKLLVGHCIFLSCGWGRWREGRLELLLSCISLLLLSVNPMLTAGFFSPGRTF